MTCISFNIILHILYYRAAEEEQEINTDDQSGKKIGHCQNN